MSRLAWATIVMWFLVTAAVTQAAPPHPDILEEAASGKRAVPYFMYYMDELRAAGLNGGSNIYGESLTAAKPSGETSLAVTGDFKILAILVEFTDKTAFTPAGYFDNLLYDELNVSVRHYYRDASYGQLDIVTVNMPSSSGWNQAPQTYAYYVNGENGVNPASYPHNSQGLVEDLVAIVDPVIDFSEYDNDNNGFVDVVMVIHAGRGAELTGSDNDMWSHQWSIYPRLTGDAVYVSSYTVQPEYMFQPGDMTIGVFAHELGHAFGLPDLYDTDYSSNGIGYWGIMGYGSWLGPHFDGSLPAHPCAWSRIKMGFTSPTVVSTNVEQQEITDVKSGGEIFRLWTSGSIGKEYFLVENRQKSGYDTYLPGSGLLIWHIDENMTSNDNEWSPGYNPASHYLVALEQCDGLFELETSADMGDINDAFSGYGDTFNAVSATNSNSYTSGLSLVAVENVSPSASTMSADFQVSLTSSTGDGGSDENDALPTTLTLRQNYPNPFNPSTTIAFSSTAVGVATVKIYNILGEVVRTLWDSEVAVGITELEWDGTNGSGTAVASGIYLYQVRINGATQTKKMLLVR